MRADLLERLTAVAGLADELQVGALLDGAHDPLPVDRMVVGDQDPNAFRLAAHEASLERPGRRRRAALSAVPSAGTEGILLNGPALGTTAQGPSAT